MKLKGCQSSKNTVLAAAPQQNCSIRPTFLTIHILGFNLHHFYFTIPITPTKEEKGRNRKGAHVALRRYCYKGFKAFGGIIYQMLIYLKALAKPHQACC